MIATMLGVQEAWPGACDALNAAAAALDLNRDGQISREELLGAISSKEGGVAQLLAAASQQVRMGLFP